MKDRVSAVTKLDTGFVFEKSDSVSEGGEIPVNKALQILRALGAIIVVAAASTFLFQRWGSGSDLQRYLFLLSFTTILAFGGFFCGIRLRESKGARTLLGLTLGLTPVNFAVTAGLLYSQFSCDVPLFSVPSYASWVAPSTIAALIAAVGSLAVLAPLGYLSFLALGRKGAEVLTGTFLTGNLVLWLPTRQPGSIGVLVVIQVFALCFLELHRFRNETTLTTFEGRLTRFLLWVPPGIMAGRTLHLYSPSDLFYACLLAAVAVATFIFGPTLTSKIKVRSTIQGISMVPAVTSWLYFARVIDSTFALSIKAAIPLVAFPVAAILMAASFFVACGGSKYRRLSVVIALMGASINLIIFPGLIASFLCLAMALIILLYGLIGEQKAVFFSGAVGMIFGLGYHLKYALEYFSLTSWGSLALTGVSVIIAGSLLERHQVILRQRIIEFRSRYRTWNR